MSAISNEVVTTQKLYNLNSRALSFFFALEIKKLAIVSKTLWHFDIILHIWSIHLGISLDITVMINILQEIITILHKKMLKAINLYWFHNNASEKKNHKIVPTNLD